MAMKILTVKFDGYHGHLGSCDFWLASGEFIHINNVTGEV